MNDSYNSYKELNEQAKNLSKVNSEKKLTNIKNEFLDNFIDSVLDFLHKDNDSKRKFIKAREGFINTNKVLLKTQLTELKSDMENINPSDEAGLKFKEEKIRELNKIYEKIDTI